MSNRLRKKTISAVCLLLVSAVLLGSASYAWLVLSARPEVASVTTNISANGTLEIALGKNIGESRVGDASEKAGAVQANRTWGNLIDLRDESYGLQVISLRPAMLNSAGGAVNTLHPFAAPVYGQDGRVEKVYGNNIFAGTYDGERFVSSVNEYGVRGIGAAVYSAPGNLGTFGPPSQRQEEYYEALNDLWHMTGNSYISLCEISERVLMAYCRDGTGVSAGDFNLNTFADYVENVVAAANEELRLNFTLLATAEATSSENYFAAKEMLQEIYPDYEAVLSLVDSAIRASGTVNAREAISELRAFQDVSTQLWAVVDSGEVNGSDGYSMEEIAQTVGLIFDLELTGFGTGTYVDEGTTEEGEPYTNTYTYNYSKYYSNVIPELYYYTSIYKLTSGLPKYDYSHRYDNSHYDGSSIDDLTSDFYYNSDYQDNDSRERIANDIVADRLNSISMSLPQGDLARSIAELYVDHWSYWDVHKEEAESLTAQIKELEDAIAEQPDAAALVELEKQLTEKQKQLRNLMETEVYDINDYRLETIRTVLSDTIEAMRQYILWCLAYYACDGRIPDDAFHRMQEIADSSAYIHPRTAYQTLCNYGLILPDELTQMVTSYENLEKELVFLEGKSEEEDSVTWFDIDLELQRIFGTITHSFCFDRGNYSPENTDTPANVMSEIRKELEKSDISTHYITYEGQLVWFQSLGLLNSLRNSLHDYGRSEYTLEDRVLIVSHDLMYYASGFWFGINIGVGTEDNFNESGLTVRQTRFREAQENISYYQNQLINAAVNTDQSLVTLLMDMIAGQDSFSTATLSAYLTALQQQTEYADELLYRAALAMAASDYADDALYRYAYSSSAPRDAAGLIRQLQNYSFDETVLAAFTERLGLLNYQESLLNQSLELLAKAGTRVTAAEAAAILDPVLDTGTMILYGYVENAREPGSTAPATYQHTLLYEGFGSPAVQVSGTQAVIGGADPVSIYPDVYLALGRSLSGALLALAKPQVELYAPPTGSVSAEDIAKTETGLNRKGYSIGAGDGLTTVNLCTMDMLYALDTDLWTYTGNTGYISANNEIVDLYGYCVDLSLRTNAVGSDLLLQTDAVNRIYDGDTVQTDTAMGAGSYMEFTVADYASYTMDMAKEYMSCIRVAITDTNTGYIYAYAALDMSGAEALGLKIKAPLRLYSRYDGQMLTGEDSQYICRMDQNLEKNLSVYVYLDGAKASQDIASAYEGSSLTGVLNLQFSSSADLQPTVIEKLR